MSAGALASDQETLRALGCTGTKTVGAGTASAAGAVFLASRSAANPRAGLLSAAFLPKADTDTLASMTASILGAFAGQEWLAPLNTQVQDGDYIAHLAEELAASHTNGQAPSMPITKGSLDRLTKRLDHAGPGDSFELADGRSLSVVASESLVSKSQTSVVDRFRLAVGDGQTMHIVRVRRRSQTEPPVLDQQSLPLAGSAIPAEEMPSIMRVGVKLSVSHLDTMRRFYQEILGMRPTRTGSTFVTFNDILALATSKQADPPGPSRLSIYLDVMYIDALWLRMQEHQVRVVDPLGIEGGRSRFRCLDPEGNVLEVRDGSQRNSP